MSALEWFQTLPVWLDLPGLRVVHACWYGPAQQTLLPYLDEDHRFTKHGLREATRKGSHSYEAAEILLKGPEAVLPDGKSFKDTRIVEPFDGVGSGFWLEIGANLVACFVMPARRRD
jgi:hypothetical protein